MNRAAIAVLLVLIVSACSTTPPKPPVCEGEYTPINAGANVDAARRGG
jgi:hypothetical protein